MYRKAVSLTIFVTKVPQIMKRLPNNDTKGKLDITTKITAKMEKFNTKLSLYLGSGQKCPMPSPKYNIKNGLLSLTPTSGLQKNVKVLLNIKRKHIFWATSLKSNFFTLSFAKHLMWHLAILDLVNYVKVNHFGIRTRLWHKVLLVSLQCNAPNTGFRYYY